MINKISISFTGINRAQQILQTINSNKEFAQTYTPEMSSVNENSPVDELHREFVFPRKKNQPLYAIRKKECGDECEYTFFLSQQAAATALNITPGNVSRCINCADATVMGYAFILASDVEKLDEDGNAVVDEALIKSFAKSIFKEESYYVIDKDGSFVRHHSLAETCNATGAKKSELTKGFQGYRKVIGDNTIVRAKHIESEGKLGDSYLDEDKIITIFIGNKNALYAVDKNGNVTLFPSRIQASGEMGVALSSIKNCIAGKIKNAGGYTYASPTQVLGINDKNQIVVDDKKIKALLAERFGK